MGIAATSGRRALVRTAEDAVAAANQALSGVETLHTSHNAFVDDFGTRFDTLTTRVEAQGQWIKANEDALAAVANLVGDTETRVRRLMVEALLGNNRDLARDLPPMTGGFLARLRWLLLGPVNPRRVVRGE